MINDVQYNLLNKFSSKSIPISLLIELTKRCNWKCGFCYAECDENDGLDMDTLLKVLDSFKRLETFSLTFTGGEPFLKKDVWEIIEYAKRLGFALSVNTNGSLLNNFDIEKIASLFSKINVSLHAATPETHNLLVGNSQAWQSTIKNLNVLKKYHANVGINSLITNETISEYWELRSLVLDDLGFSWNPDMRISLTYSGETYAKERFEINENEWDFIKNDAKYWGNSVYNHQLEQTEASSTGICRAGATTCFMDAEGNLYPCLSFKRKGKEMIDGVKWIENVKDRYVEEIWRENYMFNSLRKLRSCDFSRCLQCKIYSNCFKCVAENYIETNSLETPSRGHCEREWALQG